MVADHQHEFVRAGSISPCASVGCGSGKFGPGVTADTEICKHCNVTFRDAVRGFGSNVAPQKRKSPALQRSSTNRGLSKSAARAQNGRVTSGG